jgi:hypothetical protein
LPALSADRLRSITLAIPQARNDGRSLEFNYFLRYPFIPYLYPAEINTGK